MVNTKKNNPSDLEHPSVTVDVLVFTIQNDLLKIALVKRGIEPFLDMWAIPGGFIRKGETLEDAAIRELAEETGVKNVYLEQLYTFGDPKRDPRGRVITVSYFALIPSESIKFKPTTDVTQAKWFEANNLPALSFDHKKIIDYALERLRAKIEYSNIVHGLLPKKFSLSKLQKVYEVILGEKLDKRNFRKKMSSLALLTPTGEKELKGAYRPAMLYQFKTKHTIFFD